MRSLDAARDVAARPTRSRLARCHPWTYLSVHGLAGLVLAVACAWAFGAMADAVPEGGRLVRADTAIAIWVEKHGTETGESIFAKITLLGSAFLVVASVVVALVLLVRRSWTQLVFLAIGCAGVAPLHMLLAAAFHRPRPSFASEFVSNGSFSFPSGHAMESMVVYGILGFLTVERFPRSRSAVWIGWIGLVVLIGVSRIYLGVHYVSDIAAGFAAGFVWLFTCITGYRFAEAVRPAGASP
jgi:membrane-associated phospholipid phosphatase